MNVVAAHPLLLAQVDSTDQKISLIVFGLVSVAAVLALLTAWYWRVTDPSKRGEASNGRGGKRRQATEPDPVPKAPAGPSGKAPVIAAPPMTEPSKPDQTRVLSRAEILEPNSRRAEPPTVSAMPSPPSPEVIDLRIPAPSAAADQAGVDPTDQDGIDLRLDEAEVSSGGAHDEGLDFNEWLAMAEDES